MRLIDADAANKEIEKVCNDYGIAYGNNYGGFADKIATVIDNMPTIDAEPVVRCKNCKYFTNNIADENLRKNFCDRIQVNCFHPVKENDFCSYGAKMDEEAEQE